MYIFDCVAAMLKPTVDSKGQSAKMKNNPRSPNRLQDIWVWNGRPHWDDVFEVGFILLLIICQYYYHLFTDDESKQTT
jgi:hypothetical protein